MNYRLISIILSLLGVVMGAFGAHALSDQLAEMDSESTWRTATLYHLVHALALFSLSNSPQHFSKRSRNLASVFWFLGVIMFSGSLYALALAKWKWLGPVTPLGGLLLIAGWVTLLFAKPKQS